MPALGGLVESGHLHRMKASLPEISAVSWTDFMTGPELRDPRHLRLHGFQAGFLRRPLPQFPGRQDPDDLGYPRRQRAKEHRHQPALHLPGPAHQRRPRLRLRGHRAGQGRAPSLRPGRPRTDGLPDGHRHPEVARGSAMFSWESWRGPWPASEKALDLFWEEPWDYLRVRHHRHRQAPPLSLDGLRRHIASLPRALP